VEESGWSSVVVRWHVAGVEAFKYSLFTLALTRQRAGRTLRRRVAASMTSHDMSGPAEMKAVYGF
jgi:hypothetical protein